MDFERLMDNLNVALGQWHESNGGLIELTASRRFEPAQCNASLVRQCDDFFTAVANFCPKIEYLDGWKETYCDGVWLCSLDAWKLFYSTCVHLREFDWFVTPSDDDFLLGFTKYPKH
ncbi:hypothetical protein Gpo141_00002512 [Globisporangium polare]